VPAVVTSVGFSNFAISQSGTAVDGCPVCAQCDQCVGVIPDEWSVSISGSLGNPLPAGGPNFDSYDGTYILYNDSSPTNFTGGSGSPCSYHYRLDRDDPAGNIDIWFDFSADTVLTHTWWLTCQILVNGTLVNGGQFDTDQPADEKFPCCAVAEYAISLNSVIPSGGSGGIATIYAIC